MCVLFDRKTFAQFGEGHISPLGGYHEATDHALLLDVSKYKNPPHSAHWLPVQLLWRASACAKT